jgi:hypothetical protein
MNIARSYNCIALILFFVYTPLLGFAAETPAGSGTIVQPEPRQQTSPPLETPVELNKEYFTGYWTDTKSMLTAPARWDGADWFTASAVLGTAVVLFTVDENIQTWVQEHKNAATGRLSDNAKKIGTLSVPSLAALGLYGYLAKDGKAKKTFLLSVESFLVTGAFVQTLKRSTGRHRPFTGDSHDTWSGARLSGKNEHLSFPSGDASSAFAIASVIASEYDNRFVPPLVYTASTLIALSRVHNNAHWSSDVFVGSAIGYFTGKAIVASHRGGDLQRVSVAPILEGRERGVMVTYRF